MALPRKIQLRRGTAAQWSAANPLLLDGEIGLETDTRKRKTGNGTLRWARLAYDQTIDPNTVVVVGPVEHDFIQRGPVGWITRTVGQIKTVLGLGSAAYTASTAYDAAGSASSAVSDFASTLGTASAVNTGTTEGTVPLLGVDGKLPSGVMPTIVITAARLVDDTAARLALTIEQALGQAVVEADTGKTYGLITGGVPAQAGDWLQLGDRDISWSDVSGKPAIGTSLDVADKDARLALTTVQASGKTIRQLDTRECFMLPEGGSAENDDFVRIGYFEITADDVGGWHVNGFISRLQPQVDMDGNYDWMLPNRPGMVALTSDIATALESAATLSQLRKVKALTLLGL